MRIAHITQDEKKLYSVALGNMGLLKKEEWVDNHEEAMFIARIAIIAYRVRNVIQIANETKEKNSKK